MDANAKIKELEDKGYTVKVSHRRPLLYHPEDEMFTRYDLKALSLKGDAFNPRGGHTRVTIIDVDATVAEGLSYCSRKDNYSRRRGLQIALGRALKELDEPVPVVGQDG